MELILLEKVQNLGDLGDRVDVKPGFGRNYLMPQGMAVPATKANIEHFEVRRAELERKAAEKLGTAEARLTALKNIEAEFTVIASAEGKLYGSVGPREIADYLTSKGYAVEKSEVVMSEGPIRHTGHHDVTLQLHADVISTMHVVVAPEDGPIPVMEELFEDEDESTSDDAAAEEAAGVEASAESVDAAPADEPVAEAAEVVETSAESIDAAPADEPVAEAAEEADESAEEASEDSDKDS